MATMTDVMRKGFVKGRRPEDAVLGGVLRRLGETGDWVDFMDLPFPTPLGRDARRALLRAFAAEGCLELARHPVYPNLMKARITESGRRRLVVHVHGQAS